MIWTIIIFLLVLSVLVLVHEWGHYYTAKKIGAEVEEFGLGFPPRAFTWRGKDGMIWSLNWVPIGGFVKIKGESGEHRDDPNSFARKPLLSRFAVLIAGVVMNMIAAAVLMSVALGIGIPSIIEGGDTGNAVITDESIHITQILESSPAEVAEMQVGDEVIAINGESFATGEEARTYLSEVDENELVSFTLERAGETVMIDVAPSYLEEIDRLGVGVAMVQTGVVQYPWYMAPVVGMESTIFYTREILVAFYDIIRDLIVGEEADVDLAGPVGIAVITGEVIDMGFVHLLQFAAILSINLAIINVLPFPALDGGRIVFVLLEAVRRKPVSPQLEAVVHNFGFLILIGLIILVTYKDIVNLL